MFAAIRRWFRPRAASVGISRAAPAAPAVDQPTRGVAAPVPATAEPAVTAPYPAGDLTRHFRAQLAERVDVLAEALPRKERSGDSGALLEALLRHEDLGIRQMPAAAQEALAICNDPLASLHQLVPLFTKDPTLAQALLRQANSAFYSNGTPIVGLGDAMQRIGTGGVRAVLIGATVQGLLCRPGGAFASLAAQTWEQMTRTAPTARTLASAFAVHLEEAFVLGLLHDVGKLVVFDVATALRTERRRELQLDPALTRALLRQAHEPLGGIAIRLWGLGDAAALAIATHHRSPPPGYHDPLSEMLYAAEHVDRAIANGNEVDLPSLWRSGMLTGSVGKVGTLLDAGQLGR